MHLPLPPAAPALPALRGLRTLPRELRLAAAVLALVLAALLLPPIPQAAGYHGFADQATRWGLPHALDVLSNLGFAAMGLALLAALLRMPADALSRAESALLALAGAGLVATAAASAGYHLAPDDAGLAWDRAAMALPFAGLLGLAACRVSSRAGVALALATLAASLAALAAWTAADNLAPWVVVQAGGALLLAGLARAPQPAALPVRWWLVVAAYAVAKLLELGDHAVWDLTGGLVSGHSLKHLAAAAAVAPLLQALRVLRGAGDTARQNASRRRRGSAR